MNRRRIFKNFTGFVAAVCLLLSGGCGYKVAGFDSPAKFYIEPVVNNTIDTKYGDIVQQAVDSYFVIYGEMSTYKAATYILNVTLDKVTLADNIVTATNESVNSNVILDISIVVTEKSGKEVFSYRNKPSISFNISQSVSQTLQNRSKAIKEAMTDTLDLFRDNFNAAFL